MGRPVPPYCTENLEDMVAKFVGKEAAFVFNMGYGTNSTGIPALMGHGSLIVSDSLNHTSMMNRLALEAVIKVFQHNNSDNLEAILREAITDVNLVLIVLGRKFSSWWRVCTPWRVSSVT